MTTEHGWLLGHRDLSLPYGRVRLRPDVEWFDLLTLCAVVVFWTVAIVPAVLIRFVAGGSR